MESNPECASSLMTSFSTQSNPPNYRMTLELCGVPRKEVGNVLWHSEMSPADCDQEKEQDPHQLHPLQPNSRETHQHNVLWSRVDIKPPVEETHWVSCCKSPQMSTFAYRNLKGCPPAVQTYLYKGLVWPVLQYTSVVWDSHQQHLKSTLEMMQPWSACGILHDFSPTSSASALVAQLQLENLQSSWTSDKVCTMYKIMNELLDTNPAAGLFELRNYSSRGHKYQLLSPPFQNWHVPVFVLPIGNLMLELCPHRC